MSSYRNKSLNVIKVEAPSQEDLDRADFKSQGYQKQIFPSMEPMIVSPTGPRFSIQGTKLTFLNWQFDYHIKTSTGPAIYDVRFNNKRIAYEISLQEEASYYSTGVPGFSSGDIIDSTYKLGKTNSLIHGVDCPQHSLYFDTGYYNVLTEKLQIVKDAVCVFEYNTGTPLRRHHESDKHGFYYGGMADSALVLRFITDMHTYDYISDFIFHQTGSIEVKTTATGHLLLQEYYKQHNNKYGFQVFKNNVGGIHDHMMLYKVDLDILGRKNSFKTLDLSLEYGWDPWDPKPPVYKYILENYRKTEKDAAIRYNFDKPKQYIIYNKEKHNKYGNVRGYRILPIHKVKQVYPDNSSSTKHLEWSKYQISVTKFKENERYGSCPFNGLVQYETPSFSFDAFIKDNDNIENEDLVAWVPIGGLHIPSAEDFPTTTTTGNQFTFFLKPFNYFDEDQSARSANSVYIEKTVNKTTILTYGTPETPTCPLPKRYIG